MAKEIININELLQDQIKFDNLMFTINQTLTQRDVQIPYRFLSAVDYVCAEFELNVSFNDEFIKKMKTWFDQLYGNRLKIDLCIGSTLVKIRGNLYLVKFYPVLGRCKINPFHLIKDCTPKLLHSLHKDELDFIANHILKHYEIYTDIKNLPHNCLSELETAVNKMIDTSPEYGLSRWASLQAGEKALKLFIRTKGKNVRYTHNIRDLVNDAKSLGLPDIAQSLISQVQCSASTRYSEEPSTIDQAYDSYCATLQICQLVAKHMI